MFGKIQFKLFLIDTMYNVYSIPLMAKQGHVY